MKILHVWDYRDLIFILSMNGNGLFKGARLCQDDSIWVEDIELSDYSETRLAEVCAELDCTLTSIRFNLCRDRKAGYLVKNRG